MLTYRQHAVKKGWLYKRGNSCLSRWKLKWAVLYDQPVPALYIYDKRDNAEPKYIIKPDNVVLENIDEPNMRKKFMDNIRDNAFSLATKSRKFLFAAQNSKEREDWMTCIRSYSNSTVTRRIMSEFPEDQDQFSDTESVYSMYSQHSMRTSASRLSVASRRSNVSRSSVRQPREPFVREVRKSGLNDENDAEVFNVPMQNLEVEGITIMDRSELSYILNGNAIQAGSSVTPRGNPSDEWNERFQRQFEESDDLKFKLSGYRTLGDFREIVEYYGRKIIDRYHLKQVQNGKQYGIQDTFVYGNIMFQFATNYSNDDQSSILQAEKKAGNEIKSIRVLNQMNLGMHTALVSVIDYKGFRLVAYANMPLDEKHTLAVDLTSNQPRTEPNSMNIAKRIGIALNLKEHYVDLTEKQRIRINFASNIEIHHCSQSNRHYALNLCDMLPIDASNHKTIIPTHKFRPEFLQSYEKQLSSDAFMAVTSHPEQSQSEEEAFQASYYLQTRVIPEFVTRLDTLEILPIDSRGLTNELHRFGINVRYLGKIASLTGMPHVRQMCSLDMVARASKALWRQKMRKAVLHFKTVEAVNIEEEMNKYAVAFVQSLLYNGEEQKQVWESLRPLIETKFGYKMTFEAFNGLHKPALFLTVQHHCGLLFRDAMYNFSEPLPLSSFVGFIPKVKMPTLPPPMNLSQTLTQSAQRILDLGIHFANQGQTNRLLVNDVTAMKLNNLAKAYISEGLFEQAWYVARASIQIASRNKASYAMVIAGLLEARYLTLRSRSDVARSDIVTKIMADYETAFHALEFHWGKEHPVAMTLYDKMTHLLSLTDNSDAGLEFLKNSLSLAVRVLGKTHLVTAGYLTKAGYMLLSMRQTDQALEMFTQALHIFNEARPESESVAENHYSIAETLEDKGDVDGALHHSQQSRAIREKVWGPSHPKTIDSYQQMARLLASNYVDYEGVLTPQIRKSLTTAIAYYEKVFKYTKTQKDSGIIYKVKSKSQGKDNALLDLTRTLVGLKIRLAGATQKDQLRRIRETSGVQSTDVVHEAVLRLVHLTPTVYVEELFQRLEDGDLSAPDEMASVLQLVEKQDLVLV